MALQYDLTQGNVRSHLIRFAIPLVISNLFQALYNAVDMFFMGKFTDTVGLSAVSVCNPIMNILITTISGLSIGISVVIGSHLGNGEKEPIRKATNTAVSFYLLLSAGIALLGFFLTPAILRLVNTPEPSLPQATSYLRIIFIGIVFMFGYNLICAFQRGFGDSRTSMLFVIVAGCCNVVLDYLFVGVFAWGARGAAIATVIAQGVSLTLGICYFNRKKHLVHFSFRMFGISGKLLGEMLTAGAPVAGQQLLLNLSMGILSGLANSFGLYESAAFGISVKIDNFSYMPTDAINMGMAAFVSQNIGAGKPERVMEGLKEAFKIVWVITLFTTTIVYFGAPYFAAIFDPDPNVVQCATEYLHVTCFSYLAFSTAHPMIGFLRGSGNSMQTLKNAVVTHYVFRVPLGFLAAHFLGFKGIAVGVLIAPTISCFSYGYFIWSGKWKKSRLYQDMLARMETKQPLA